MAARLPIPGKDDGTWGDILNKFLKEAHNTDGSLKSVSVGDSGALLAANNLSDVQDPEEARNNLGISSGGGGASSSRIAKHINGGQISGIETKWNPTGWNGGAGDVDVITVDPVIGEPPAWQANHTYYTNSMAIDSMNSVIRENGVYWAPMSYRGITGSTEPTVLQLSPHASVAFSDGSVKYVDSEWLWNNGQWAANTNMNNDGLWGDPYIIIDGYLWEGGSGMTTGSTEPDWGGSSWVSDGDGSWSRRGPIIEWSSGTTVDLALGGGSGFEWPYVKFPSISDRVFMAIPFDLIAQSGGSKPSFNSGQQYYQDNEIIWMNVGDTHPGVLPHLLGLDASNAEDGRLITIHFSGNVWGAVFEDGYGGFGGGGAGYGSGYGSGLTLAGIQNTYVTVGVPAFVQAVDPGYIEGTFVSSTGSVQLMWDAGAEVWRVVGGGNERPWLNTPEFYNNSSGY